MLRASLVALVGVVTGGCLGIEGTDVSTSAAVDTMSTSGGASEGGAVTADGTAGTTAGSFTTTDGTDGGSNGTAADSGATDTASTGTAEGTSGDGGSSDTTGGSDSGSDSGSGSGSDSGSGSSGTDSGSGSSSGGSGCGNDVVELDEECDGTDLNGFDCASLGLGDGVLACSQICYFDTSGCSG